MKSAALSKVVGSGALAFLLSLGLLPPFVFAHPEGFSGIHVTITDGRIRTAITLHTRDLGTWFPPGKYTDYVSDVSREMERTASEILELQIDEEPLVVENVNAFLLEVGLIEIDVDCQLPPVTETVELLVWSKHLIQMPRGHQQLLFIEDCRDVAADAEHGVMRLEDVLTIERDAGAVLLPPIHRIGAPSVQGNATTGDSRVVHPADSIRKPKAAAASDSATSRISFFLFGVEHIISGYDHLLFLAALLLICTKFKEAAAIVTCFTVAHSITLALAALDVVRLPARIVEPTIAATIVFVAVENLVVAPPLWRRAAITCLFGLIHGLGFASALRDIGLGTVPGGVALPLLKFNMGVEAGQLAIASVFLPVLLLVRRNERVTRFLVPAGSICVASIGAYWLVTRVVSQFAG
ncbi:MAG: HupE/UreJ family protein [Planctomycetaceae bacterium]|nr:HupE/UreJ family protein [Planctomycetales bacterium]MCB9921223.1 HupE/UreJ family protein [Planctomycetaceae bacterium]